MQWNWFLYRKEELERIDPFLTVNSSEGAFKLAEKHHGIISFPDYVPGQKNISLNNIFPEIYGPKVEICCIFPERVKYWTSIMKIVEHLTQYCQEDKIV